MAGNQEKYQKGTQRYTKEKEMKPYNPSLRNSLSPAYAESIKVASPYPRTKREKLAETYNKAVKKEKQ